MNILVVDDSRSARHHVRMILETLGELTIIEAANLADARAALTKHAVDLALVDVRLSDDARNRDGLVLVKEINEGTSAVAVCVTASGEMAEIRTAMRYGAYDYILKDDLCEEIIAPIIEGLRSRRLLEREVSQLRARVSADAPLTGLVGTSQVMDRLRETLRRVALSDRPALIVGPTGAGKEVVARTLHALGPNPDAPLLEVNCGAFAENLIESELFGHEKGAFTGADQKKPGYFSSVGKGTLFLDEIAELPMSLQTRLLRVLESGRYRPVGANAQEQRFEGRVVAATHADLLERVREKRFREDLYFRLNVLMVKVPALDEHREDIPALLAHFLKQQRRPLTFTPAAVELLMQQSWSGNVRQLRSLIDRIAVMSDSDTVTPEVIGQMTDTAVVSAHDQLRALARTALVLPIAGDRLDALGSALIDEAMTMCAGNKSAAARVLGVHRKVVERRLGGNGDEGSGKE
jgi:DNA-binding NtrC family response regulator